MINFKTLILISRYYTLYIKSYYVIPLINTLRLHKYLHFYYGYRLLCQWNYGNQQLIVCLWVKISFILYLSIITGHSFFHLIFFGYFKLFSVFFLINIFGNTIKFYKMPKVDKRKQKSYRQVNYFFRIIWLYYNNFVHIGEIHTVC